MASAGKDTETTQFFVTHSPQPHLDGRYTAFGWVESGWTVLDALGPEDLILEASISPG
jgi:peptidylprolyl isomerase